MLHLELPGVGVRQHNLCLLERTEDMEIYRVLMVVAITAVARVKHIHLGGVGLFFFSAMTARLE